MLVTMSRFPSPFRSATTTLATELEPPADGMSKPPEARKVVVRVGAMSVNAALCVPNVVFTEIVPGPGVPITTAEICVEPVTWIERSASPPVAVMVVVAGS